MLSIPNQLEGAYVGQDVQLECHTEAYPTSINYWTTEKGDMIVSGKFLYCWRPIVACISNIIWLTVFKCIYLYSGFSNNTCDIYTFKKLSKFKLVPAL